MASFVYLRKNSLAFNYFHPSNHYLEDYSKLTKPEFVGVVFIEWHSFTTNVKTVNILTKLNVRESTFRGSIRESLLITQYVKFLITLFAWILNVQF